MKKLELCYLANVLLKHTSTFSDVNGERRGPNLLRQRVNKILNNYLISELLNFLIKKNQKA